MAKKDKSNVFHPPINKEPKEGMRVRLISMVDDPNPIPPGTEGTIVLVDDMKTIHVNWDNGRRLGLIPDVDKYQLIESSSGGSAIKSAIKKTPSAVNKSMPKPTKISSNTKSELKSSGIKTGQVTKNFKSANIKDVKVEQKDQIKGGKADKLRFVKPKFEFEWEEAIRYPEFEEMGKDGWVEIAKNGHTERYGDIKDILGNVDLDFNSLEEPKKERFQQAFNNGKIETPIAVKFGDSDYDLVAGNTRLSGLVNNKITNFPIWVVDISHLMENIIKEDKIKGGKADKLSIKDLAKKHKVSVEDIKKEIKIGVKIEKEHVGNDVNKAKEIAMDHISEFKDYYSNKRYGVLASEKGLKKSEKKKKIKTETTAAAGGASVGAYTGQAWGSGPLTKSKEVAKPGPIKEFTATFTHSGDGDRVSKKYDDTRLEAWADKNNDGWRWNDVPLWEEGEIVDPLAKIETTWDDENLDISKEWDSSQKKKLKKEDVLRMVKTRLNESKKKVEEEEESIEETTTFGSVWGSNGPPVGPAFAAKKGQWKMVKKPIWKGGTIIQQDFNEGILNPINETNKVKYNPKGKYVKIKKKCTKFPYCSQGAIDNPINLSNTVKGSGTYVEGLDNETIKNIHEISKQTGKPFNEIYKIVKERMKLR